MHGKTRQVHDEASENCLSHLESLNLKLREDKCEFLEREITFYGLVFSARGTKPDPDRQSCESTSSTECWQSS